jgi:hypothetical protein
MPCHQTSLCGSVFIIHDPSIETSLRKRRAPFLLIKQAGDVSQTLTMRKNSWERRTRGTHDEKRKKTRERVATGLVRGDFDPGRKTSAATAHIPPSHLRFGTAGLAGFLPTGTISDAQFEAASCSVGFSTCFAEESSKEFRAAPSSATRPLTLLAHTKHDRAEYGKVRGARLHSP